MISVVPLVGHNLDLNGLPLYLPFKITDRSILNCANIKAILSFGIAIGLDNWQVWEVCKNYLKYVIKEKYQVGLNNNVFL